MHHGQRSTYLSPTVSLSQSATNRAVLTGRMYRMPDPRVKPGSFQKHFFLHARRSGGIKPSAAAIRQCETGVPAQPVDPHTARTQHPILASDAQSLARHSPTNDRRVPQIPHRHNCGVDPRVQVPSAVHTPNDRVPSKSGGFPLIRTSKTGILPYERAGNTTRSEEFVRFDGCAGMSEAPTPSGRRPRHPSGARRCVARGSPERESPERGRRLRHEESRRGQRARADGKHGDG